VGGDVADPPSSAAIARKRAQLDADRDSLDHLDHLDHATALAATVSSTPTTTTSATLRRAGTP
jgi:hypothetical protein